MSDAIFDAMRAAGEYPPKFWGWQTEEEKRKRLAKIILLRFKNRDGLEHWMVSEAIGLGMLKGVK